MISIFAFCMITGLACISVGAGYIAYRKYSIKNDKEAPKVIGMQEAETDTMTVSDETLPPGAEIE